MIQRNISLTPYGLLLKNNFVNDSMWGSPQTQHFYSLDPVSIMDAVDELGFTTTGRCLQLNSMENRVYELEVELPKNLNRRVLPHDSFKIVKFYRPGRWSKEQIQEEHDFLFELEKESLPVITPLSFDGVSLFELKGLGIYYCLYDKTSGRSPQELNKEDLRELGTRLAQIHILGRIKDFKYRNTLSLDTYGKSNLEFLIHNKFIPPHMEGQFKEVVLQICESSASLFKETQFQRIHGDCHLGNLIHNTKFFSFLDFDDCVQGPAIQDLWLISPTDNLEARNTFIDSYCSLSQLDKNQFKLIPTLRCLRMIHFAGWIARRWEDPSFKNSFPQFSTDQYWDDLINDLRSEIPKLNQDFFNGNY